MKMKKDTTLDLPNLPKTRGGTRIGAGRKKNTSIVTRSTRIDVRLTGILIALRERLKNGTIDENELKEFEALASN
jgi:hypothetical protein